MNRIPGEAGPSDRVIDSYEGNRARRLSWTTVASPSSPRRGVRNLTSRTSVHAASVRLDLIALGDEESAPADELLSSSIGSGARTGRQQGSLDRTSARSGFRSLGGLKRP